MIEALDLHLPHIPPSTVAAIVLLFGASAFFSSTETAFFSLQKPDLGRMSRGTRTEQQVVRLVNQHNALLATILLGNECTNIALAAVTGSIFAELGPSWLNVVLLTPFMVLFAEITPKVLASRFRLLWAGVIVWPLSAWYVAAFPARFVLSGIVTAITRLIGVNERDDGIAEEALIQYVVQSAEKGELDPMERDIIEAVFEFDELTVERLMTPRPDVIGVPLSIGWEGLLAVCRESGLSRIPVTGHTQDDIVGVLLVKDLLRFRNAPLSGPRQLRSLLLPPVFVPASKAADGMLREFLEKRFHMAFVVDEHGTFVGLVTMDDLLGELLGADDEGSDDAEIERRTDALTVRASIDLEDFEEQTGIRLPEGEYHTLGGFVFHQLGRLPRKGETVAHGDHVFLVSRMEGRRVSEIVVTSATPAPAPDRDRDQEAM